MRRIVMETTRTAIRLLVLEGAPARPAIRQFLAASLDDAAGLERLRRAAAAPPCARVHLVSAIPREHVMTRVLSLPSTEPRELVPMAALAGKAQWPVPAEHLVTAFDIVDQQAGVSTVQLLACRRDLIDRHVALLRQLGIEPAAIAPHAWGLLPWYLRLIARQPATAEPVLLVHVDADHTDMVLLRGRRLLGCRTIGQGAAAWRGDAAEQVLGALDAGLAALRAAAPGVEIGAYGLTGAGPLATVRRLLEERWSTPVAVHPPQGRLALPDAAASEHSPAAALGVALAETGALPDLLPPPVRRQQRARRRRRALAATALVFVAVILGGIVGSAVSVRRQERRLAQVHGQVREVDTAARQVAREEAAAALAQQSQERRRRLAGMLATLFQQMPPELSCESLIVEPARGALTMRGTAPSVRVILDYLRALERSGQWQQVALRSAARRAGGGPPRTAFEAVLQ